MKQVITANDTTLGRLYPTFNAEELKEAESFWTRYLELALLVYEELRADPERYARFLSLTRSLHPRTMNRQRPPTTATSP